VAAVQKVKAFLDLLVASFEDLQAIIDGDMVPADLRDPESENRSMIVSATMLRALAGVYHDLSNPADAVRPWTRSEVVAYFKTLAPRMRDIPIANDDEFWLSTEAFIPGTSAPQARQGSLNSLVRALVQDAKAQRATLSPGSPAEEPEVEEDAVSAA
jgi:hypothetical protein